MSTATEDRKSPPRNPALEGVLFSDIGDASDVAPETPLTREAVIHLRAAGSEVSRAYGKVRALLATVERALAEPSGGPKRLSEEERMDLAKLLRDARETADHGMQRPVFERGRGERPHGGAPHLSMDEDGVRELVTDLYRIDRATSVGDAEIGRRLNIIARKAETVADRLCEEAGIPVNDETLGEFLEAASSWAEQALGGGTEAVDAEEES